MEEHVVYLKFKKACEVSHFYLEISDLIFPYKKCINPPKKSINYNPHNISHFLLLQDYFPAVADWLKLESYICK